LTCPIPLAPTPGEVHRVAHGPDVWEWSDWVFVGKDNRFDDPLEEYRVLYVGSTRFAAFLEVLDSLRPGAGDPPNDLPDDWRDKRRTSSAPIEVSARFADLITLEGLRGLEQSMGAQLAALGFPRLDLSVISGNSRAHYALCQAVSRHLFNCRDDNDPQFDGICYRSRPVPDDLNYAVFERPDRDVIRRRPSAVIQPTDPDLLRAMRLDRMRLV
jgi:RES domain